MWFGRSYYAGCVDGGGAEMLGSAILYNFGKKVRLLPKLYLLPVDTTGRFFSKKNCWRQKKLFLHPKVRKSVSNIHKTELYDVN